MLRALRVLEQERRPAGLDDAIDDLGDLEVGIDLCGDADELALALEERDPLPQVFQCLRLRSQWVSSPIPTTERNTRPTTSIERIVFFPSCAAVSASRWNMRRNLSD
jgi:hypothetical protein